MTNRTHPLHHAGSAIAAALAIAATPSLAQDAPAPLPAAPEPVIVVPDIPTPVVPEPTVVQPASEPATIQPVPEPTAETAETQPAPPPASTARTRAPVQTVRAAPAAAAPAEVSEPAAGPVVETPAAAPPAAIEPVSAEPIAPATAAEAAPRAASDNTGIVALVLGGLLFLALAIWAFIAIGRRKPVRRYAAETVEPRPAPLAAAKPPVAVAEPVAAQRPTRVDIPRSPAFTASGALVSGGLPHAGASVALPARVPQDYAERDALMQRMIAAKPDRANPFTDRHARTKRARLILQSLGRDFGETEPWIDFSQYPNNWPELAHKRSAAA